MSRPAEPEFVVPAGLEGGAFANAVRVFYDIEYVTIDFARRDPNDSSRASVVVRVNAPPSCILDLKERVEPVR